MSSFSIPGITLPSELDSEDLQGVDYLPMPSEMATFRQPLIPEVEDVDQHPNVLRKLNQLLTLANDYPATNQASVLGLDDLNEQERRMVDQFLGEGEVSIVQEGEVNLRIQESVLAGIWRIQEFDSDNKLQQDSIEVASIPTAVLQPVNLREITIDEGGNDALMNARPVLAEVIDRNREFNDSQRPHVINLSLLPVNEADINWLTQQLGYGGVNILSRGYGNCRITRTALAHVWWVQYFNSMDTPILNTLEITRIPEVACAAEEDIADSAKRLDSMLEMFA